MTKGRRRLKLILSYNGAPFAGWQSQANGNGIQDHVEAAFRNLCGETVRVHGAGRTDAGVHAFAQCAHVDVPAKRFTPATWLNGLNALLPPEIRIERCFAARSDFHARFDAKAKTYRYRIWNAEVLSALKVGKVWHVISPIDRIIIAEVARQFVGRHDFAAFTANRGHPVTDTVRTIKAAKVRTRGALIEIEFSGDGFLYKMVRLLVGTLVRCATGKDRLESVRERLSKPATAGSREVAPAAGLYLVRVGY